MTRRPEQPDHLDEREQRHAADRKDIGDDSADAQLGAMRAVWRSMRDDDPPDGGLDDLLAAARHKAAVMAARPTLRERVRAVFRRPPALAFATVVVLIGGAVLVVGRSSMRASHLTASPARAIEEPRNSLELRRANGGSTAPAGRFAQELGPTTTGGSALRGAGLPRPGATPAVGERSDNGADSTQNIDGAAMTSDAPALRGSGTSRPDPKGTVESAADDSDTERLRDGAGGVASVPASRAAEHRAVRAPPARAAAESPEVVARDRQERLDFLYRQCAALARRGDCAAVRRLVKVIAKTEHGDRARVVKDATVARCLAD